MAGFWTMYFKVLRSRTLWTEPLMLLLIGLNIICAFTEDGTVLERVGLALAGFAAITAWLAISTLCVCSLVYAELRRDEARKLVANAAGK